MIEVNALCNHQICASQWDQFLFILSINLIFTHLTYHFVNLPFVPASVKYLLGTYNIHLVFQP